MYSEIFSQFFLISLQVLVVYLDETKSQDPFDWIQESNDELNREIKLQHEMMEKHAASLWKIAHKPSRPDSFPSKPPETTTAVVTPSPATPRTPAKTPAQPDFVRPVQKPPPTNGDFIIDLKKGCIPTPTVVSERREDGRWKALKKACSGDVIFEDNFSTGPAVDDTKWSHEVKMPHQDGYGFIIYQESIKNSYVKDGVLFIKPTMLDEWTVRKGHRNLENCTGRPFSEECERTAQTFNILPPIETALLTTKNTMSFKYGIIDIRAKLPMGDWIIPELRMEPRNTSSYRSNSGLVHLAMAKGNRHLMNEKNEIGNNVLEMGFEIGDNGLRSTRKTNPDGWGSGFHRYTLIWTPDNLKFQVDDNPAEPLCPQGRKLYEALGINIGDSKAWKKGSNIAPFDKQFYLTLGLSVGGLKHFPDTSEQKPWGDRKPNALYTFWQSRQQWLGTWQKNNGDDSALQIDYVKITAI